MIKKNNTLQSEISQNKSWTKPRYMWGIKTHPEQDNLTTIGHPTTEEELIGRRKLQWVSLLRLGLACEKDGSKSRLE